MIEDWYDNDIINKYYKLDPEQYRQLIYDPGLS